MSEGIAGAPGPGFPDVALVGAPRCGTSFLAARLSGHPAIDGGSIKEPNFFSRNFERGVDWYDGLYEPRRAGLLRLDASTSYTMPQHPEALGLLAAAAPESSLIYAVRDPLARAVSHYRLLRHYFGREEQATFGEAIAANPVYLGAGDYERWIGEITERWGAARLLVVPFSLTTKGTEVPDQVFRWLGLPPLELSEGSGDEHRHEVVQFRHPAIQRARRVVIHNRAYPWVRRTLGPARIRRVRAALTKRPDVLTTDEALASCTPAQREEISSLVTRSRAAARAALGEQDARLGLDWAAQWEGSLTL